MPTGTVKAVLSGDMVVITGAPRPGSPPPQMQLGLGNIIAPKLAGRALFNTPDENFGFAAREFLREKLIGQNVEFKVDYSMSGQNYGRIMAGGSSVSVELVRNGYASVGPLRGPSDEYKVLLAAEQEAKENKAGIWGDLKAVREMFYEESDGWDAQEFFKLNKNQRFPCLIENVRDAGCVHLLMKPGLTGIPGIPKHHHLYIPMQISGISTDGFTRSETGEDLADTFAQEAKDFLEMRLLQRDVEVRFEAIDPFESLHGTIFHPNGNIAVALLKHGLAKVSDSTVRHTENPSAYRKAQREAQMKTLRMWNSLDETPIDRSSFEAKVMEVVSGDCIIVKNLATQAETRLYMSSIRCPRVSAKEAFAVECREFCRTRLIGRVVEVQIEYSRQPVVGQLGNQPPPASDESGLMLFGSIIYEGKHLGLELVKAGLAQLMNHRADEDRAEMYDDMLTARYEAEDAALGIWSGEAPTHRFNDLVGPTNVTRARALESSMVRMGRVEGIVEQIFHGGRFRVRVPKENCILALTLVAVNVPQPELGRQAAEPYADEAFQFARELLLQREVTIEVKYCNKGGSYLGSLWCVIGDKKVDFAKLLCEEGFATVAEWAGEYVSNLDVLTAASRRAEEKNLRVHSLVAETSAEVEDCNVVEHFREARITQVNNIQDFYIQQDTTLIDSLAQDIRQQLRTNLTDLTSVVQGQVILAMSDKDALWHRAKVDQQITDGARVTFIDTGVSSVATAGMMKELPKELSLSEVPAQAIRCCLAGVIPSAGFTDDATRVLKTWAESMLVSVVSERTRGGKKEVFVRSEDLRSVNEEVVSLGFARLDRTWESSVHASLESLQASAKAARVAMWAYGDCADEDAPADQL